MSCASSLAQDSVSKTALAGLEVRTMSKITEGKRSRRTESIVAAAIRSRGISSAGLFDIRYSTSDIPDSHASQGAPQAREERLV